jgi:hypothetical protein
MKLMPVHEYKGYTVVLNNLPAPDGQYFSVFSIHQGGRPDGGGMRQLPVAYQEGNAAGVICHTAEEAHEQAAARARKWIDENPVD